MVNIHPTAIVEDGARIGKDVQIGAFSMIGPDVSLGNGVVVGSHVVIEGRTVIGERTTISPFAAIGGPPQDTSYKGEPTEVEIGPDCIIREYATVHRGTARGRGRTVVGAKCFMMIGAHVAHDCTIGDNVIMANSVNLAGHIEVGDYAILGGVLPVHQFVKIGAHAMVGGGFRVQQDVCPYALVAGYPLKVVGINAIGLKRRGFKTETIRTLELVFKILFFSKLNTTQAVERIHGEVEIIPEVQEILEFLNRSNRGIVK